MSHANMKLADLPAYQYKIIPPGEVAAREREEKLEHGRRLRRESQLREEYRHLKDFKVVLQSPDGAQNTSYRLEELFEMYALTKNWRSYVSSEF